MELQLTDPPPGVTPGGVETIPGGLAITFRAEKGKVKAGAAGNLIVEVYAEIDAPRRQGGAAKKPPAKPDAKPETPKPGAKPDAVGAGVPKVACGATARTASLRARKAVGVGMGQ